jgi:glutathionyl-hydroquinone reductase
MLCLVWFVLTCLTGHVHGFSTSSYLKLHHHHSAKSTPRSMQRSRGLIHYTDGDHVIPQMCAAKSTTSQSTTQLAMGFNLDNNDNDDNRDKSRGKRTIKGFSLLEWAGAGGLLPSQGLLVSSVQQSWQWSWRRLMDELAPHDAQGNYVRPGYTPVSILGDSSGRIEPGRYHVYVGNPCPWCHRVVLARYLRNLEATVAMTRLEDNPRQASRGGWIFSADQPDTRWQSRDLRSLYDRLSNLATGRPFTGRCTAPLLVDVIDQRIVSNDSRSIVHWLCTVTTTVDMTSDTPKSAISTSNKQNDKVATMTLDLYPAEYRAKIDATYHWVYNLINNGVYRCGFATSQEAYNRAANDVHTGLQRANDILSRQDYLVHPDQLTEADVWLLPTLMRFEGVYGPLFRAGPHVSLLRGYPALDRYLQRCWQAYPAIRRSIDVTDACASYYRNLFPLVPSGIQPLPVTPKSLGWE